MCVVEIEEGVVLVMNRENGFGGIGVYSSILVGWWKGFMVENGSWC